MAFGFLKKILGSGDAGDGEREPDGGGAPEETFNARADAFWRWFAENEQALHDSVRDQTFDADGFSRRMAAVTAALRVWLALIRSRVFRLPRSKASTASAMRSVVLEAASSRPTS